MIKLLAIGLLTTSLTSHATDYIVKLKNSDTKNLKSFGEVKSLDIGNFALLKTDIKIESLKSIPNVEYI
jgi:hypothetical protein